MRFARWSSDAALVRGTLRRRGFIVGEEQEILDRPQREEEDHEELRGQLSQEVLKLPESLREAIHLYYYEGKSTRRVARALSISKSAVKARLMRGRDLLRKRLWRELEPSLRQTIPSARDWRKRGRTLAFYLMASVGAQAGCGEKSTAMSSAAKSIAARSGVASASAAGATSVAWSFIFMSAKKLFLGLALAALLLAGGVVVVWNLTDPSRARAPVASSPEPANSAVTAGVTEKLKKKEVSSIVPSLSISRSTTGISGTIFLEGVPASGGVNVAAAREGTQEIAGQTISREDGTFLLSDLPPGRYIAGAWKGAWGKRWDFESDEWIEVQPGMLTEGCDLMLSLGVILEGYVVEKGTKKPIPGALVRWFLFPSA